MKWHSIFEACLVYPKTVDLYVQYVDYGVGVA